MMNQKYGTIPQSLRVLFVQSIEWRRDFDNLSISALPTIASQSISSNKTSHHRRPLTKKTKMKKQQQQQKQEQGQHIMSSLDSIYQLEALAAVGQGPMLFGPVTQCQTIQQEALTCSPTNLKRFVDLKLACDDSLLHHHHLKKNEKHHFTDAQIFRVAQYKQFRVRPSLQLLKKMDSRYMNTTIRQLEDQLQTKTLFPLPRVQSLKGNNNKVNNNTETETDDATIDSFFYMRPCRFNPNETPTSTIIANLIYVMDTLYERHRDYQHHKIGFIANMNNWTMTHFSVDYCYQFMQALQGRMAPIHVNLFLIVNPPVWFDRVWKIMKPMLSPSFRKKVHMIPEEQLDQFLAPGFAKHLPDEFQCGQASVSKLVDDFITFRKFVEESSLERGRAGAVLDDSSKPAWAPTFDAQDHQDQDHRRHSHRQKDRDDTSDIVSKADLVAPENSTKVSRHLVKGEMIIPPSSWSRLDSPWEREGGSGDSDTGESSEHSFREDETESIMLDF